MAPHPSPQSLVSNAGIVAALLIALCLTAGGCRKDDRLQPEPSSHRTSAKASKLAAAQGSRGGPVADGSTSPKDSGEPANPPPCSRRALNGTRLGSGDAFLLCQGAETAAPVQCYERATRETVLPDALIFELCRCATSTESVDCFLQAHEDTMLHRREVVRLCSPVVQQALLSNCQPMVGLNR